MTNDYKETLLDYVTGNLENTSPSTNEIYKEITEVNRSKWTNYMPSNWDNMKIEGFIKSNEKTSNLGIMYGGYKYNNASYGFIILVDNDMNPIKYITEYDTGTKLRYIQCMIQGDDNLFYAIDDSEMSYNNENIYNTQKRFLMLNNFSVEINGEYKVTLRKDYILNGIDYQNFYCSNIYKEPNTSHFVFTGEYAEDSTSPASRIKAIEVQVNVGMENEWNFYKVDNLIFPIANFVSFNSDGAAKIQFIGNAFGTYKLLLESKDYTQTTLNESEIYTFPYRIGTSTDMDQQGLYMDENNIYFIIDNQDVEVSQGGTQISVDRHLALFHYDFTTSSMQNLYDNYLGSTTTRVNIERMQITKNEGKLYIAYYNNFGTNKADYYYQRYEGSWNPILIGENKNFQINQRAFYVGNNFNLLQITPYNNNLRNPTWYFPIIKEVYNQNQYNGTSYINTNALNPLYVNLYSNNSLIFSRNLYNISKQNNVTMASVEIPNNYLNDITISQNDLISETNLQMNSDNTNWTKNIYEVVDVNFLNTISVIDEDTSKAYLLGATRINNSITDINDYENASCTKVRINYEDNTTKVFPISWEEINSTHKQTTFTIYVDKPMINIDFISNDENTLYLTKQLNVIVGKYYTINEKIKVGE